jgi:hypothetical protein
MLDWLLAVFHFLHGCRRWRSNRLKTDSDPAKFFDLAPALIARCPPPDPPLSVAQSSAPLCPFTPTMTTPLAHASALFAFVIWPPPPPNPPSNNDADNDGEGGGRRCGAIVVVLLASLDGDNDGPVTVEGGVQRQ